METMITALASMVDTIGKIILTEESQKYVREFHDLSMEIQNEKKLGDMCNDAKIEDLYAKQAISAKTLENLLLAHLSGGK